MARKIVAAIFSILAVMIIPAVASAHVVVKPAQVDVGAFQTFTIGVPNEKDNPTVAIRLVIPSDLKEVSPNVKPGWTIDEKKSTSSEGTTVTEINWTGGVIPVGERDDFVFSAQAPATATTLKWKAYQTYSDGTVIAWDETPGDKAENPYSQTKVINDLSNNASSKSSSSTPNPSLTGSYILAGVALMIAIIALITKQK